MKTFISGLLPMFALLVLGATQPAYPHGDESHGEIGRDALNALYTAYLDIHKALSRDDLESAQKASRDFLRTPRRFPTELSHNVKAADLVADLRALNASRDITAYRKAFRSFSDRMILLLSEAKNAGDMAALVYHCPMAFGNAGADWLQAGQGVQNPYFGASMFRCGSMKKTLHAGSARAGEKPGAGHEGHH